MYELIGFQIPYKKNSIYFPDNVDNILTYVERDDLQGRPFKKFQQFDLPISIILPCYKNSFVGAANYCFKIEHDKVNNIPF